LIQSCPHGLNKVVDILQKKFTSISKTQLRNKVREVSKFVDNHWEVNLKSFSSDFSIKQSSGHLELVAKLFIWVFAFIG
jgi:chromatin assembly factor 1 subunit A